MVREALEVLDKLEATEGRQRNSRTELLVQHKDNHVLRQIFILAYDWRTSFYITAPENLPSFSKGTDLNKNWESFLALTEQLRTRTVTGSSAQRRLKEFLLSCSELEAKWYGRCLNRDLRCGVATGVLAKVWPELAVDFGVALAERFDPETTKLNYPVAVEPKIDGVRIAIVIKDGHAVAYSRNFREYPILRPLGAELAAHIPNGVVDGELHSGDWGTTISALNSKLKSLPQDEATAITMKLRFHCFDLCGLQIFDPKHKYLDGEAFQDRRAKLETILKQITEQNPTTRLRLTPQHKANSLSEIEEYFHQYVVQGYEGVMIKSTTAPYLNDRSTNILKWKAEETEDCEVIGFEEGKGSIVGKLGAFIVNVPGRKDTKVGSGFSAEQREQFWQQRDSMLGSFIEVKHQRVTGMDLENVALRIPVFVRLRPDKTKEQSR